MTFDFRAWARFAVTWLRSIRWTPRRTAIVVAYFVLFPLIELYVWIGLMIDNLLFRGHRSHRVEQPVFIIGNPRSGTTFLHRLLSRDRARYSTMKMWEILLAPAITHRAVVRGFVTLDRWLGAPLRRRLDRVEAGWQEQNVMHEVSFREPEEDDYLLLHIWSALTIGLSAGLTDLAIPYTYFDEALPPERRRRIMGFYRRCLKRHLFAHRAAGGPAGVHYLAKNPALCPKLDTVFEFFPDAKIIYLARNPLEMIPSYVSMMEYTWGTLGARVEDDGLADYVLRMAGHWYRYPLERLARAPEGSHIVIRYDDLVGDPEGTVRRIYSALGFEVDADFARVLEEQAARARGYRSRHRYRLRELGLSRARILGELGDVFDRFGFDRGSDDGDEPSAPRREGSPAPVDGRPQTSPARR